MCFDAFDIFALYVFILLTFLLTNMQTIYAKVMNAFEVFELISCHLGGCNHRRFLWQKGVINLRLWSVNVGSKLDEKVSLKLQSLWSYSQEDIATMSKWEN